MMEQRPGATQPRTASPQFFQDLNAFLTGDLARFQSGLAGTDDLRPSIHADDLLQRDSVAAITARFEAKFGKTDPRAIMSMWASSYFTETLPPLLAANVMLDVAPVLELDQVAFIMAPSLRVQALKIKEPLVPLAAADGIGRFNSLVFDHLAPFIERVADRGGVTQRVLWSNAGNVFEAFLRKLKMTTAERPGFEHARSLLASKTLLAGKRNPLFQPVRYVEGQRIRRVCCMRYLIPNERVCGICPLAVDNPARVLASRGQRDG